MPPRTANSPTSRTVGTRSKPEFSSRPISAFMSIWLPGRARSVCASMTAAGGMRCSSALAVVSTTARCGFLPSAAIAGHRIEPARRRIGAGRDAVVGQAVPGRQLEHRQFRRGKGQRLVDGRQPLAVARDEHDRTVGRELRRRGRQRKRLVAVGARRRRRQRPLQPFRQSDAVDQCHGCLSEGGSSGRTACSAGMRGCAASARCRCRPAPASPVHPGHQIGVRQIRAAAHIGRVRLRPAFRSRHRRRPEDQVHLAHAAMPRAEQQLAAMLRPVPRSMRVVPVMRSFLLRRALAWIEAVSALQRAIHRRDNATAPLCCRNSHGGLAAARARSPLRTDVSPEGSVRRT